MRRAGRSCSPSTGKGGVHLAPGFGNRHGNRLGMYIQAHESGMLPIDRLLSYVALRYGFIPIRSVTYAHVLRYRCESEPVVPL